MRKLLAVLLATALAVGLTASGAAAHPTPEPKCKGETFAVVAAAGDAAMAELVASWQVLDTKCVVAPDDAKRLIDSQSVVVLGGKKAVPDEAVAGLTVIVRLAAADRVATANAVLLWVNQRIAAEEAETAADGKPKFAAVSAGRGHACGLRSDGTAVCWGTSVGLADAPGGKLTAVSAGAFHSCGIRSDGTAVCWGANSVGQTAVPAGTFAAVSAGDAHSCGIRSDGTAVCWGGIAGLADAPGGKLTAVSAGAFHSCGIRSDGTAVCWGANSVGQTAVPAGTFAAVSAGGDHSCGIRSDGTAVCWGRNSHGQTAVPAGKFTAISAGWDHSCGIRSDGTAVCWGHNHDEQADAPGGKFTAISAGWDHSCGIRSDGTAVCWGHNHDYDGNYRGQVYFVESRYESDAAISQAENYMIELVNELRTGLGIAPLTKCDQLGIVARRWSNTLASGEGPLKQLKHNPTFSAEYPAGWSAAGENIASAVNVGSNIVLTELMFGLLVNSPGHYKAMTNADFNSIGVGYAVNSRFAFVTQNFANYPAGSGICGQ